VSVDWSTAHGTVIGSRVICQAVHEFLDRTLRCMPSLTGRAPLRVSSGKSSVGRKGLRARASFVRGAPIGQPFRFDEQTIGAGFNFTLDTTAGPIVFLGEVVAGGRHDERLPKTVELRVFGQPCRVVSLPCLIALERAAGRPKDLEAIAELEILDEERE
jgi:hypothetical protein